MKEKMKHNNSHSLRILCKKTFMVMIGILLCCMIYAQIDSAKLNAKIVIEDDETAIIPGSIPVVVPGSNITTTTSTTGNTTSETAAAKYSTSLVIDWTVIPETSTPTSSTFTNLCTGAVSWVANRAIQELTSILITADIDGLSDFLVLIQSPQARTEMEHKQLVKKIAEIVLEIKESVANIENQLDQLTEELRKYETAAAYERATISLRENYQKYQTAWINYQSIMDAVDKLNDLEDKYPEATRTETQKKEI